MVDATQLSATIWEYPMEIYESYDTVIWQTDKDIYGNLHNCKAIRTFLSPFRQLEQCEDDEIRFYNNRFRNYNLSSSKLY